VSRALPLLLLGGLGAAAALLFASQAAAEPVADAEGSAGSSKAEGLLKRYQAVATTSPRPEMTVYDVLEAPGQLSAWFVVEGAKRGGLSVVIPAHFFDGVFDKPGVPNRIFVMPKSLVAEATENGLYRELEL
jgi:hypothetical protein